MRPVCCITHRILFDPTLPLATEFLPSVSDKKARA